MANEWVEDIDSTIFTLIKINMPEKIKSKYPSIKYTKEDSSSIEAKFPTVKIAVVGMTERGNDLENTSINAIDITFQIDVLSNKNRVETKEIIFAIVDILKMFHFNIRPSMPIPSKEGDIYRYTMRAQRIIGAGDILF